MVKKNKVGSADVVCHEKYKTWTDDSTKFMLQWYVDYQKDKPATFRWKQHHHHLCAEALNARFGIGATRHQVYRHFRAFKEKWNWISQAMAKNGNGFDAASHKFNLPYSEKSPSKLGILKYDYLTRPIKFFHLMEELFGESGQANGSLAVDQYTLDAEDDRSESGSDDSFTAEHDPYANRWKRIEDIPFPPRDKVDIASFLSKPEQVYLRNYLNAASDQSFGTWVTDYLGAKYGASGGYVGEYGSSE